MKERDLWKSLQLMPYSYDYEDYKGLTLGEFDRRRLPDFSAAWVVRDYLPMILKYLTLPDVGLTSDYPELLRIGLGKLLTNSNRIINNRKSPEQLVFAHVERANLIETHVQKLTLEKLFAIAQRKLK